ncbi:hypothetical protein HDU96_009572 [Phlyctochytrium bullatum]|nr:hypothetical protein HDU96_009572 [Phlyctochytrium bullatum]
MASPSVLISARFVSSQCVHARLAVNTTSSSSSDTITATTTALPTIAPLAGPGTFSRSLEDCLRGCYDARRSVLATDNASSTVTVALSTKLDGDGDSSAGSLLCLCFPSNGTGSMDPHAAAPVWGFGDGWWGVPPDGIDMVTVRGPCSQKKCGKAAEGDASDPLTTTTTEMPDERQADRRPQTTRRRKTTSTTSSTLPEPTSRFAEAVSEANCGVYFADDGDNARGEVIFTMAMSVFEVASVREAAVSLPATVSGTTTAPGEVLATAGWNEDDTRAMVLNEVAHRSLRIAIIAACATFAAFIVGAVFAVIFATFRRSQGVYGYHARRIQTRPPPAMGRKSKSMDVSRAGPDSSSVPLGMGRKSKSMDVSAPMPGSCSVGVRMPKMDA